MARRLAALALTIAIVLLAAACSDDDKRATGTTGTARTLDCEWPMFGRDTRAVRSRTRRAARPRSRPSTVRRLAPEVVPHDLRRRDRDTRRSPTAPRSSATGRAASTRSRSPTGTIRWTYTAPPQKNVYSGPDRRVGGGRRRRRRAARVLRVGQDAVRGDARPTARCAGSTSSIRAATRTTSPRSSRRRWSRTAW